MVAIYTYPDHNNSQYMYVAVGFPPHLNPIYKGAIQGYCRNEKNGKIIFFYLQIPFHGHKKEQ